MRIPHYILAGGRSRRFGSDKARARVGGACLIEAVATRLFPEASGLAVVADLAGRYADLGLTTIADAAPHRGPLGGLATALQDRQHRHGPGWLMVSACDLVDASPRWSRPLIKTLGDIKGQLSVVYIDPAARWQPLPGLYHTDLLPTVQRHLADDQRSLCRLLDGVSTLACPLPSGCSSVPNANTPSALAGSPA